MKKVKFGGYQHRYWLQQQQEISQHQEWMLSQLLDELEQITNNMQIIRPLTLVAQLQASVAQNKQIAHEMVERIGEPNMSRLDEILEKINLLENSLEEIVMKTS